MQRTCNNRIYPRYRPRTKRLKKFFFYKINELHNTLPIEILELDTKKFKSQIKTHVYDTFTQLRIPNDDDTDTDSESES